MLLRIVVVLLAVSLCAGSVCAQPVGRDSLKGIGATSIGVEPGLPVTERQVLLAGLHTAVELRLRQNGVPITESFGLPYLYINVTSMNSDDAVQYAYCIEIQLRQSVPVVATKVPVYGVATWERGGSHPSDRCSSQLRWNPGS